MENLRSSEKNLQDGLLTLMLILAIFVSTSTLLVEKALRKGSTVDEVGLHGLLVAGAEQIFQEGDETLSAINDAAYLILAQSFDFKGAQVGMTPNEGFEG